jgi:O-antigen/teichoic acid export membrane protein
MLSGYTVGFALVGLIGLWYVSPSVKMPNREHFRSLKRFAQYSLVGLMRIRVFGWVDILVLGLFVSSNLIGIYSVSWAIGTFFLTFGEAVSGAIFPEISKVSATDDETSLIPIIRDAIGYAGLFAIPGLVGSILLGPQILVIYGPEFVQGTSVLSILVASCLFQSYYRQFSTALGGIDNPEYSFYVDIVFISTNAVGNFSLVYLFGWVGAAVATALSAIVGVVASYALLRREIKVMIPFTQITKQWVAALIMGTVVYICLQIQSIYWIPTSNMVTVFILVLLGAGIYFLVLFAISRSFRKTIRSNTPLNTPW